MSVSLADQSNATVAPVDFRRPSRVGRDAIVALETTHEVFARRLSTAWSSSSYTPIEVEHVATDQLSIDDFVRSLPVPTALATVRVGGLGAVAFIQVDLPFGLLCIERILGGMGDPGNAPIDRRPTDLEGALLTDQLLQPAVSAIDEALRELDGDPSALLTFETVPQPMQLGSPGELLLMLSYQVDIRGDLPAQGLVTLAYPVAALVPQLDTLLTGPNESTDDADVLATSPLVGTVLEASLDVRARIGGTTLSASTLAALEPGDVLRLDHHVDRPADLVVNDRHLGSAYLGKRGRKVAVQIAAPPTPGPALAPWREPSADGASAPARAAAPSEPADSPLRRATDPKARASRQRADVTEGTSL